jgi:hypothetical protein
VVKLTQLPSAGPAAGREWLVCLALRSSSGCGTWEQLCQGEGDTGPTIDCTLVFDAIRTMMQQVT